MQKNDSYELDDDELVEDLAVSQPLLQRTAPELSFEIMTQSTSSALTVANLLVLGSKTMSVLITPSIRIDTSLVPILGSSPSNGFEPTLSTCVFITKQFVMWYQSMAFDAGFKQLYSFDEFAQLHQVGSKFSSPSTYLLCRSSSVSMNDIRCRLATLWNLVDFSSINGSTTLARLVSCLFRAIATKVLDHGKDATLALETVVAISSKIKDGPDKVIFESLIDQFNDKQEIPILENQNLNRLLTQLANSLSTAISNVNTALAKNVYHIFYNDK
ncbi:hypothetical protein G6F36_010846 [Rhizopus arrhizus]|nr:hypothetical protein G6F36_010846 [Rhizopus arrhizus]